MKQVERTGVSNQQRYQNGLWTLGLSLSVGARLPGHTSSVDGQSQARAVKRLTSFFGAEIAIPYTMHHYLHNKSFSLICTTALLMSACALGEEKETTSDKRSDTICKAETRLDGDWQYLGSQSLPMPDSDIETTYSITPGTNLILDLHVPYGEGDDLAPEGREKNQSYFVLTSTKMSLKTKGKTVWIATDDKPSYRSVHQTEADCPALSPTNPDDGIDIQGQLLTQDPNMPFSLLFALSPTETKEQANGFRVALTYPSKFKHIEKLDLCIVSMSSDTGNLDSTALLERFSHTSCYKDHQESNPLWPWVR